MSRSKYFDRIEAYLTGGMSAAEATSFEQEVSRDEALALELELQKLEHDAMNLMLEEDLKGKMGNWSDAPPVNPFAEEPAAKIIRMDRRRRTLLSIAAAVGGILLVTTLFLYFSSQSFDAPIADEPSKQETPVEETPMDGQVEEKIAESPAEPNKDETEQPATPPKRPEKERAPAPSTNNYIALATTSYQDPPPFASRLKSGEATAEKSVLLQAAEAFDEGRYPAAIDLLGLPTEKDQSSVRYLRGHTYFKLKKFNLAADEFKFVASDEFLPNYQEAQWYLLLSYLALLPNAENDFRALALQLAGDEYSDYREEAKKLLDQVDK